MSEKLGKNILELTPYEEELYEITKKYNVPPENLYKVVSQHLKNDCPFDGIPYPEGYIKAIIEANKNII